MPHVLLEHELEVPQTWEDFFAVARAVTVAPAAGAGFGQRGRGEWHTMYTGFATQLWSCGGRDFDLDGRAAFADAEAVAATAAFIGALRDAGPSTGRTSAGTSSRSTSAGAAMPCSSTRITTSRSSRTSASPSSSAGSATRSPRRARRATAARICGRGLLAMTAASRDKRAARDFITWAASKPFLLRSAGEGNMNPTRASTWDDPAFQGLTAPWGEFAGVSRRLLDDYATVLVSPTPHYREIALRWTEALREAYHGRDVSEALRAAATRGRAAVRRPAERDTE